LIEARSEERDATVGDRRPAPRETWSIGIYGGTSPLRLAPPAGHDNPVLSHEDVTDLEASFVADPFIAREGDRWYMLFEVFDEAASKGAIGLAVSEDGLRWAYRGAVLREDYHLSYPYLFKWQGDYYMIPETLAAKCIRLYRATRFPTDWCCVGTLLEERGADPSILRRHGFWWLFTCPTPYRHHTLRLHFAETLQGPWHEHPGSPLVAENPRRARPAGRLTLWGDRAFRFAQDCTPCYGTAVRAFEITELSPTCYREREVPESPLLGPAGSGWNGSGMHHLDPCRTRDGRWIACVDGLQVA